MNVERPRNTTSGCTHQLSARRVWPNPERDNGTSMWAIEHPPPFDSNDRLKLSARYHTQANSCGVLRKGKDLKRPFRAPCFEASLPATASATHGFQREAPWIAAP